MVKITEINAILTGEETEDLHNFLLNSGVSIPILDKETQESDFWGDYSHLDVRYDTYITNDDETKIETVIRDESKKRELKNVIINIDYVETSQEVKGLEGTIKLLSDEMKQVIKDYIPKKRQEVDKKIKREVNKRELVQQYRESILNEFE